VPDQEQQMKGLIHSLEKYIRNFRQDQYIGPKDAQELYRR